MKKSNHQSISRRHLLTASISGGAAIAAPEHLTRLVSIEHGVAFAKEAADDRDPIHFYWDKKLSELLTFEPTAFAEEEKERHRIYCATVFALLSGYFNGNRRGELGEYPMRTKQKISGAGTASRYKGGHYFGHNICAIAVDEDGEIIDFDFNTAELLNDSTQHAEVRLIKRLFSLADAYETLEASALSANAATMKRDYNKTLNNVTIYTSMESCAQCSGTMTLANIPRVIFIQSDPTQYEIGKIMYRLSRPVGVTDGPGAPRPISGAEVGFGLTDKIDKAYNSYRNSVGRSPANSPFFKPPGSDNAPSQWDASKSITSFICTDPAMDIFAEGRQLLDGFVLKYPRFQPSISNPQTQQKILTNQEVLANAHKFLAYALTKGKRAISR